VTVAARFHGVSFRPRDHTVRAFGREALAAELADPEVFSWVDLESEDTGPLLELLDGLGFDRRVAHRLGTPEILPWIVERPHCVAFRLYEIGHPEAHLDTSHGLTEMRAATLLVALGRDVIVTWHPRPLDVVDEVRATAEDAFRLAGRTPGFVAFLFLQRCLYDYADLNLANDNFLDRLEPSLGAAPRAGLARDVALAGGNILLLKKLATSLHLVCMLLATKRTAFVSEEARASFRDLQENAMSVRSAVDSSRDLLDGVVGAAHAAAADRTTRVATVLTVLSAILLPLSLVAGLWGMNFEDLPLSRTPGGFWWLVGGMLAFAVALVWAFRRLTWMGGP
jgi:magnesium transporter